MAKRRSIAAARTKPNYLYAISSVALVLFILGFFGLLLLNAQQLIRLYKEQVNIIVELGEDPPAGQVDTLRQYLAAAAFTKSGSVTYLDKNAAADLMRRDFGDEFLQLDLPNPFFDIITFNVKGQYLQLDSLRQIREQIQTYPVVSDVFYQESLLDEVVNNLNRLQTVAIVVSIFFVLVAMSLIYNTIRLALYANRFLIKNMELVGASWGFISRPYLGRALLHGLISGLITCTALALVLSWIKIQVPELELATSPQQLLILGGGLLILGALIYLISTYFVVNKYLNMRVDDLY
ncbi:MAG: hypothetical protein H6555_09165 [Lewinellaceae bacterium]|nr:hypothetical protein [Lewinellaceae bacterium]